MPGCKSKIETILSGDGDEKAKLEAIKTCLESEPDDDDVEKSPLADEEDKPALEAEGDEPEPEDEEDEDKKPGGFKTESILTRGLSRKLESLKKRGAPHQKGGVASQPVRVCQADSRQIVVLRLDVNA